MKFAGSIYARYVLSSAAALALDMGAYLLMLQAGLRPVPSSMAAYALGLLVHWLLSTRFVFRWSSAIQGGQRLRAKALFLVTALLGLGVTAAVVAGSVSLGASPEVAKILAVAVSFNLIFLARRLVVFAL